MGFRVEVLDITNPSSDPSTHLALSSRNAYLTPYEREHAAPTLFAALEAARSAWQNDGRTKSECIACARAIIERRATELKDGDGTNPPVSMLLDYVQMNDPETFDILPEDITREQWESEVRARPVILSGAMWLGKLKTRLIDNVVLGDAQSLGILQS